MWNGTAMQGAAVIPDGCLASSVSTPILYQGNNLVVMGGSRLEVVVTCEDGTRYPIRLGPVG